jgi:hypothetical protein
LSAAASLALAIANGALGAIADYPRPHPFLAWFAAAPVLIAALRRGPRAALWLGSANRLAMVRATRDGLSMLVGVVMASMVGRRRGIRSATSPTLEPA